MIKSLQSVIEHNSAEAEKSVRVALDAASFARNFLLISFVIVAVALVSIGLWIVKSITGPLNETVCTMESVAEGDLTVDVTIGNTNDELSLLKGATKSMITGLTNVVVQIQSQASDLGVASDGLKEASSQVLLGSETQSEATSSMAAALEEMSTSISHVADLSTEAQLASTRSGKAAKEGAAQIQSMVNDIGDIAHSIEAAAQTAEQLQDASDRISRITDVIKDVADQTNLLALNAAIEAARAGETGRGFAVVADEVRKLAEKSGTSAQEISAMISEIQRGTETMGLQMKESVSKVRDGLSLAQIAGQSITAINEEASQVVQIVDDVSIALKEQSAASQSIADRVENIVQMIEENNVSMRSVAATAHQLDALAARLKGDADRFNVRRL